MSQIFINYRRDDSAGYAGRLYDRLSQHFGQDKIFMDIGTIEPGVDFVKVIRQAVGSCDVLIALIGKQWLTIADATGRRRLDDPNDFIRLEIKSALERDTLVIPVLVRGATMPRAENLPDELAPLARRNAVELSDSRFDYDVNQLIRVLEKTLVKSRPARPKPRKTRPATSSATPSWLLIGGGLIIGALLVLCFVSAIIFFNFGDLFGGPTPDLRIPTKATVGVIVDNLVTVTSTSTGIPTSEATLTDTPVLPTATGTRVPTASPTNTSIPPTATSTNTPTPMPVPPTKTSTPTPTFTPFPDVETFVRFTLVTGSDGTTDDLEFELLGNLGDTALYSTVLSRDLGPNTTEVFEFLVPLHFCDFAGFRLTKLTGQDNIDDSWFLDDLFLEVDGQMVYFDRAAEDSSPVTASSFPYGGGYSGTANYQERCGVK